ncbi:MAG: septal ring lytic transglycosylase RlpA family protein [Chloroflexota bacterium]
MIVVQNKGRRRRMSGKVPMLGALLISCVPLPGVCAPSRKPNKRAAVHKVEYGTASWYGKGFQGREMACGEKFDEHALSAAHRTLPLGAKVEVTNLRNGRSVVVKIKDRGPWVGNRLIDLSKAAAARLRFIGHGLAPVEVRVLSIPKRPRTSAQLARTGAERRQKQAYLCRPGGEESSRTSPN